MSEEEKKSEQAKRRAFDEHYRSFFQLIGHCVTRYQTIEDYLEAVFCAGLSGDVERAKAIFAVVRGLDSKLELITAALNDRDEDLRRQWPTLRQEVKAAAESRNDIAHSSPTTVGAPIVITLGEKGRPASVEITGKDRMEARKKTRSGEKIWTVDQMREELKRLDWLFSALIVFVHRLKGTEPPEHLTKRAAVKPA